MLVLPVVDSHKIHRLHKIFIFQNFPQPQISRKKPGLSRKCGNHENHPSL